MAFKVWKIKTGPSAQDLATLFRQKFAETRFSVEVETPNKTSIAFRKIRLTYKKDFCGNHPCPCPVRPGPHRKHPKNNKLEGADWVGFNDYVNDVLDAQGCVCNAGSSLVMIRKEGERCMEYSFHELGNGIDKEWDRDSEQFQNYIGKTAPRSYYPEGTPGFATAFGTPNYPENHEH